MSGTNDALEAVIPGKPTWIEASAGTGKTWTLERIIARRVELGATLESILVVTFTDKATREMRARVRATLEEALKTASSELTATRLRAAILSFDRATIATLHGFCRRTLREHAFLSGRVLEEQHEGGRALFGSVFRRWLTSELDAGGAHASLLSACLHWLDVPQLEELCLRISGESAPLEPAFDAAALDAALALLPSGDALEAMLPDLVERVGTHPAPRARLGSVLRGLDVARAPGADRLGALLRWGGEGPRGEPAASNAAWLAARLGTHPTLGPPLRVVARSLMTPLPALATLALPALEARIAEEKARASIVDFDDLVSGMDEALKGPRGAALIAALRERYRHVVVDEFQDTDPLQWSILSTLFLDCAPDRTFILIGDPKQAIYGFRGADVHTYRRAKATTLALGTSARLDTSYRATPVLLDALHEILLPPEEHAAFFTREGTYEAPVRAGNAQRDAYLESPTGPLSLPPLTVLAVRGDPPLRLRPARRALARAIADEARRLLASETWVTDGKTRRTLTASDLFVLTRSQAEGLEVAEALSRAGVPYAFFKQDGLFQTPEAKDFSDLLSALVVPEDAARRARALATPFFAVAPEDFDRVASLPFSHPMLERFRALAARTEEHDVAGLCAAILRTSGITKRELYLFASERRLTNYLHLAEVLTSLAIEHRCGARELAARLAALVEGGAAIGEGEDVQRIESERAAVQLLTMHKSKGLEAEVVFVYGGLGRPRTSTFERRMGTRDGQRLAWLLPDAEGTSDPQLEAAIAQEERQESERLLYVAMTRARSLLYLPLFLAEPSGGTSASEARKSGGRLKGPYRVVQEQLAALHQRGALVAPRFRVEEVSMSAGGARKALRREPMAAPESALFSPPARATPPERYTELRERGGSLVVTSYSRMKSERDRRERVDGSQEVDAILRYHEPDEAALPRVAPTPEDPGGAGFGVAVHRALELLPIELARAASSPEELARGEQAAALFDESLVLSGLDARALPLLSTLVYAALRTPVPLGDRVLADLSVPRRRAAEVPFFLPLPEVSHPPLGPVTPSEGLRFAVERGYLRGVIDLLFEHEGRLYLVDWKTDRLDDYGEKALRAHIDASYAIQVRLYALALERMLGRAPFEERFGGLLYVFMRGLDGSGERGLYYVRPSLEALVAWDQTLRTSDEPFGYPLGLRAPSVRRGAT